MFLTDKGEKTLKDAGPLLDRLFNAGETEVALAKKLEIERTLIVTGDAEFQVRVYQAIREYITSSFYLPLPSGHSMVIILVSAGLARSAALVSVKVANNSQSEPVPGRAEFGEYVETPC